jgi:adenine-specific DNA-methyltransferase
MALLDDLVSQAPDVTLRRRLQQAVNDLRRNRRFGLTFEEHVPETIAICGAELTKGTTVQRRDDPEGPVMRIQQLLSNGGAELATAKGQNVTTPVSELLLVKRFGEPMYASLEPLGLVLEQADLFVSGETAC